MCPEVRDECRPGGSRQKFKSVERMAMFENGVHDTLIGHRGDLSCSRNAVVLSIMVRF
jgi:hypothetical protein